MCAYGYPDVTHALMAYRPESVVLLAGLLEYERREEIKRRHLGDIVCLMLRCNAPEAEITMYSALCQKMETEASGQDARGGEEIVSDVKEMLKKRIEAREGAKDESI